MSDTRTLIFREVPRAGVNIEAPAADFEQRTYRFPKGQRLRLVILRHSLDAFEDTDIFRLQQALQGHVPEGTLFLGLPEGTEIEVLEEV